MGQFSLVTGASAAEPGASNHHVKRWSWLQSVLAGVNFPGVWCEWQAGRRAQCWCLWAPVFLKHKWLSKSETRKHQAHWYIGWINKQGACCQTVGRNQMKRPIRLSSGPLAYQETIGTGKSWAGRRTDHALGTQQWGACRTAFIPDILDTRCGRRSRSHYEWE